MRASATALAALAVLVAAPPALAGEAQTREPKPLEVSYAHESADDGPDITLEAFVREADSVLFKVSYAGEKARAVGREYRAVTAHGGLHPWVAQRADGGKLVYRLMEESIDATGAVTVKVIAENDAGKTKVAVPIIDAECSHNPPLYDFGCYIDLPKATPLAYGRAAHASSDNSDDIDSTDEPEIKRINWWSGDAVVELESVVIEADSVEVKVKAGSESAAADPRPEQKKGARRKWGLNSGFGEDFPGTRDVVKLTERAMAEAGTFTVKVVARNEAGKSKVTTPIVASECTQNPPIYPYDCIVTF